MHSKVKNAMLDDSSIWVRLKPEVVDYRKSRNMNGYYVCKRMKLYSYLISEGFFAISCRPDRNNPKYFVWIFPDSKELNQAVTEYYKGC